MTLVAGASRYLSAATAANVQGLSPSIPTVTGESSTLSLLDAGRAFSSPGIGLSASSRAGINSYLNSTNGLFNSLFTLGAGASLSTAGLQTQILGLRAQFSDDQIADQVKVSEEIGELQAQVDALGLGSLVDQEA